MMKGGGRNQREEGKEGSKEEGRGREKIGRNRKGGKCIFCRKCFHIRNLNVGIVLNTLHCNKHLGESLPRRCQDKIRVSNFMDPKR